MGRSQRDIAGPAALGGGLRGRQILQPSRRRLGRAAGRDRRCRGRRARRGGSTITQQVAKNLFLWPGRSVIRKGLELPLAMWIDLVLPKQRILEIYLNIAELGPSGQFGAEAGAHYAFGRSAATLSAARRPCWRRSCPIRSGAAPASPGPGCAGWPGPIWRGPVAGCSAAGAKIVLFEPILAHLPPAGLALRHPILYKRGLIGIAACA